MQVPPVFLLDLPAAPSEHASSRRCKRARGSTSRSELCAVEQRRVGERMDQHGPDSTSKGAGNPATSALAPVLRSTSSIADGARWRAHGPRGGVVEVVRGCAANTAGTVVANDVTEPPVRLKYAYDGRRPRGAPYRAPAYPGEGGEGRKHRESTTVSGLPPFYERIQGRSV